MPLDLNTFTSSSLLAVTDTETISVLGIATSSTRMRRKLSIPGIGVAGNKGLGLSSCAPSTAASDGLRASKKRPIKPRSCVSVGSSCALCAAIEDPSVVSPIFSLPKNSPTHGGPYTLYGSAMPSLPSICVSKPSMRVASASRSWS